MGSEDVMEKNSYLNFDVTYSICQKTKFLLVSLLIILNIIIRIPSIPHEKGYDSFFIHTLANSISNFGFAKWWIHWSSVFGLYPYSYASAVPFTLSGISQLTGFRTEITILLFCVFLGLFSIFGSYLLAEVLYDDFLFKFIFASLFSISSGILTLTTWEISTRSQILVFFPFLLYIAFQITKKRTKYVLLYIMAILMAVATHHFFYIMLFYSGLIIIFSWFYKLITRNSYFHFQGIHRVSNNLNYIYISILFFILFFIFFFGANLGLIASSGSRYVYITDLITIAGRNVGFVLPLSVGGLAYLALKKDKLMEEWSILICFLPTLIFATDIIYGYILIYLLAVMLGSIGLFNLFKNQKGNGRIAVTAVIMFLLLNVTFSAFFVHFHVGIGGGNSQWFMREETYKTGEWIKTNINLDKKVAPSSTDQGECFRLFASYGGQPAMFLDDTSNYMNGFITFSKNNVEQVSTLSKSFYSDNPFVLKAGLDSTGAYNWMTYYPINSEHPQKFVNTYNISYFFKDIYTSNPLFDSLYQYKNNIYNSGRMQVLMN
jgi:hypothetical protein